jgi:hypothetical protein
LYSVHHKTGIAVNAIFQSIKAQNIPASRQVLNTELSLVFSYSNQYSWISFLSPAISVESKKVATNAATFFQRFGLDLFKSGWIIKYPDPS